MPLTFVSLRIQAHSKTKFLVRFVEKIHSHFQLIVNFFSDTIIQNLINIFFVTLINLYNKMFYGGGILKIIESELNLFNKDLVDTINKYPNKISKNICDFIFLKSKKIRPILIFLITKSLNLDISKQLIYLAVATEIIHNATLIHDDIIDNANIRRGKVSLNIELGNNLSVLSGDILLSFAMQKLIQCENMEILNIFAKSLTKMCIGEINQQFSLNTITTVEDYIEKSQYKTAELFKAAFESLCILYDIKNKDNIINFSINYATAFQIKDDLINILKTDKTKPSLSDIYNGIYTLPVILLAQENEENFKNLTKEEIIDKLLTDSKVINETKNLIEKYANKAIDSLNFIRDNQYKNKIIELTQDLYKAF